jgi:hypothetical protein
MDQLYYTIMQQKTDKELVRLVYFERNEFHHEGVLVAEEEIRRRAIPEETIEQYKKELEPVIAAEKQKAEAPLPFPWRIMSLFLPGALPFMLSKNFEEGGELRKARELRRWSVYGFILYSLIACWLLYINFNK